MTSLRNVSRRSPGERGIAVIVAAVMMFFTVGTVGLAIDGGLAYLVKGRLMAAVDAASLGAARSLNLGEDVAAANVNATGSARRFFAANFPEGYMGTDPGMTSVAAVFEVLQSVTGTPSGVLRITVTGEVTAPTYFMNIFSVARMRVSATGTATRRTLVMMMILDVSGSMQARATPGIIPASVNSSTIACDAMVYSASKFLDYFSSYDYVGAITFSSSAAVVYPPSTNYKRSDGAGLNAVLKNLNCAGGTNTAPSINLAWDSIRNVGLKLAMNEVLLFTDGMPNIITGNFPLRTQRDTRFGPGVDYGISPPPTNASLLYIDPRNPLSGTTYNLGPNVTPTLDAPYTAAQNTARAGGSPSIYGNAAMLPLTATQYTKYTDLDSTIRNAFGWHLASAAGPYNRRWTLDALAPVGNYDNCRNPNTTATVLNRGITWMCSDMPLPATGTIPASFYGGIYAASVPLYDPRFGRKLNALFAPVTGELVGTVPSGFRTMNSTLVDASIAATQTIAHVPDLDAKGNSNYGFRENWVYNVDEGCAPAGTPLPNGSTDLCKFRGGLWSAYPAAGLGTNKFTAGPYINRLRTDLPNAYPAAAMNSAVDAAKRAKSDTDYNIRFDSVYLIGNENNADREFLQIVANVQVFKPTIFDNTLATQGNNPFYNANHQQGLWYSTTNAGDMTNLFALIAGSLLRLSA